MASTSAAQAVLPEEIWEDIFLRLDATADLARASSACSSFRRLVSARRFLHRFRSLHTPPALGMLTSPILPDSPLGFVPVEPPNRAARAARALARAADFTFSFLPKPHLWRPRDARDGCVLLSRPVAGAALFEDLVVCDPLHRRYVQIPRIPDDLMASVPEGAKHCVPFLGPAGEDDDGKEKDGEEPSSFRVFCILKFENKLMAFVFSSAKQEWRLITYLCSIDFGTERFYAHGCYLWMAGSMLQSLVLDTRGLKFFILDLLPNDNWSKRAIVEAEEGRLGLLIYRHGRLDLFSKIWQNNAAGAGEWRHDKTIPLPKHSDGSNSFWYFGGALDGYLTLVPLERLNNHGYRIRNYFVLDLKTWLLERLCAWRASIALPGLVYASFPPPFAPPAI